eukprot:NODE_165_length_1309_cov_439.889171_g161_i0.p1 GENE.NODE_165_length_1309_cov_439.889171_g161_i0~~NODE_165_length_1309_cov_439.889171_g161_i0.p1  ORF type:complete len:377 (+),score=62.37 NODE_165_length_1309_cov_439.889171_g161_i0:49-1179(+)
MPRKGNKKQKEGVSKEKSQKQSTQSDIWVKLSLVLIAVIVSFVLVPYHAQNLIVRGIVKGNTLKHYLINPTRATTSAPYRSLAEIVGAFVALHPSASTAQEGREKLSTALRILGPLDVNLSPDVIRIGNAEGLWFDLTKGNTSAPTILYIHGGGFVIGSAADFAGLVTPIAKACGANLLLMDYRLLPENTIDDAIQDVKDGYSYLVDTKGNKPGQIVVLGDSAGGALTLQLMFALIKQETPLPAGIGVISPAIKWQVHKPLTETITDLVYDSEGHMIYQKYLKDVSREKYLLLSERPVEDFAAFPPTYIAQGASEEFTAGGDELAEKLIQNGVNCTKDNVDGMPHDYLLLHDWVPEAEKSMKAMASFIKYHTSTQK